MTTNDDFIPVEAIEFGASRRVRTEKRIAIGAAAMVAVAAPATVFQNTGNETARPAAAAVPLTMDEKLQDLVDRGLIPRQALEKVPVAIIFGPAHPLGAPDIGIPCSELVYTRC